MSRAASHREPKAISVITTVGSGPLIRAAAVPRARDERMRAREPATATSDQPTAAAVLGVLPASVARAGRPALARQRHVEWLRAVRRVASEDGYPLVINARVDVFLWPYVDGAGPGTQEKLVGEALRRATAYLEAGVDCVYPIVLWETDPLRRFMSEISGPVNVTRMSEGPAVAELAELGVARVSWALYLYWDAIARFKEQLATLQS
jgi:2-methylisocitrate lyase-like PEP mutase family enzyme